MVLMYIKNMMNGKSNEYVIRDRAKLRKVCEMYSIELCFA